MTPERPEVKHEVIPTPELLKNICRWIGFALFFILTFLFYIFPVIHDPVKLTENTGLVMGVFIVSGIITSIYSLIQKKPFSMSRFLWSALIIMTFARHIL